MKDQECIEIDAEAEKESEEAEADIKRDQRAERFKGIYERHQIPKHGAQTIMAKAVGVSDATIAAWMRGSLPRDPDVLIKFCDVYGVCLHWWVEGVERPREGMDVERAIKAAQEVEAFSEDNGLELQTEHLLRLIAPIYNEEMGWREAMLRLIPFLPKKA